MPEQHDPINELSRFGSGFSNGSTGGDMSLSAADVRRRGDQIRRRRTALVAGGAALAVAAVTVPILALAGNGGEPKSEQDLVADDLTTISAKDLLRDADTEFEVGKKGAYATNDTYEGDGQATFHPCQQEKLSALGAMTSFTRTFDYVVDPEAGDVVDVAGDGLVETIAEFEDDTAARAAYDTFIQWVVDCDTIAGAEEVNVIPQARSVDVPAGGDAVIYDLQWGPAPVEVDPFGDSAFLNETGVIVQDDRIAVVALTIVGQDYNYDPDFGSAVERMIPTAAERLQADGSGTEPAPGDPSEPGESEGEASSVLAPGFDLVADMVTNDNGDPVVADPTAEGVGVLDFCSNTVDPGADAVERLAANASGPEYAEAREVIVTSSKADADALVATILSAARACPEPADVGSTSRIEVTTREDQPMPTDVITQTYLTDGVPQLGTSTWVVSRLGPIVFVAMTASEGNPEPEALQQSTDEFLDRLATPFGWIVDSVGS